MPLCKVTFHTETKKGVKRRDGREEWTEMVTVLLTWKVAVLYGNDICVN